MRRRSVVKKVRGSILVFRISEVVGISIVMLFLAEILAVIPNTFLESDYCRKCGSTVLEIKVIESEGKIFAVVH